MKALGVLAAICVLSGCVTVRARMGQAHLDGCPAPANEYELLVGTPSYDALPLEVRREFEREAVHCMMAAGNVAMAQKVIATWAERESGAYRLFIEARLAARDGDEAKCRAACEALDSVGLQFFINYVIRQPELERYRGAKWLTVAALRAISPNERADRLQKNMEELAAAVGSGLSDIETVSLMPATPSGGLVFWTGEVRDVQVAQDGGAVRMLVEAVDLKSEVVARDRQALSTSTSGTGSVEATTRATPLGALTTGTMAMSANRSVDSFVVTDRVRDSFVHSGRLFVLRFRNVSSAVLKLKSLVVAGLYAGKAGTDWPAQQSLPLVEAYMLSPREEREWVDERIERAR